MILLELIIATLLGIMVGTLSGLTPGIHINMISLLVLALSSLLVQTFGIHLITMGVFIIAMGVVHTFLDAIPSIFLGAPNENTILGVLPGHRYLLRGNGLMAVKLFTLGSFFGLIAAVVLFPILIFITTISYKWFEPFFAIILIAVSLFMLWNDQKKWWAAFVFMLAGIFGMIVFNLNMKDPLFPMLSGLFGSATLIISLNENNTIPTQNDDTQLKLDKKKTLLAIIAGNMSAFIVSTFPGLSGSIAALISMQVVRDLKDHGFMILMGVIGTAGFVLSLVALYSVDKARNGAVIVIAQLMTVDIWTVIVFLCVALIAGGIAVVLSLWFGRIFAKIISRINYRMLVYSIIGFVTLMVFLMTSWIGLLVLITSTAIGIIPGIVKVQRTQAMACLIVPIILYLI
ncbi:MAG: tripartite tricarboxylate transporter permease [Candidatus Woesearchaeota archaeon]